MARLRIKFDARQVGAKLKRDAKKNSLEVKDAFRRTAEIAAAQIQEAGRVDIASAGAFGARWIEGFTAELTKGGGATVITVRQAVSYWRIFQFGGVINGKPLLWIPLSFATEAKGINARDYPFPLFRVDRKNGGAPLLLSGGRPVYFGKESVTIPKKFHLIEIAKEVGQSMREIYKTLRQG